jgi:hypothetical protein
MRYYSLFYLLICCFAGEAQSQLGSDINGERSNSSSGHSVSLSAKGEIVAIGEFASDDNGKDAGQVRVFKYESGKWNQVGSDIVGDTAYLYFGSSVAISSSGDYLAVSAGGNNLNIGFTRVYKYISNEWVKYGNDIPSENFGDISHSSKTVSISDDGQVIAQGAPKNDDACTSCGYVRVFKYSNGEWQQLGDNIEGDSANERLGTSVSLNHSGDKFIAGSPGFESGKGCARIFKYQNGGWIQLGSNIVNETIIGNSGESVSMSSTGDTVAIGEPIFSSVQSYSGRVRVFRYNNNDWEQIGSSIHGETSGDRSGEAISISANGQKIAIGARYNDGGGANAGHVRIYSLVNGDWVLGSEIDGESAGDMSGYQGLCLSKDGRTVAIGASFNNGTGTYSGHTRVFGVGSYKIEMELVPAYSDYLTYNVGLNDPLNQRRFIGELQVKSIGQSSNNVSIKVIYNGNDITQDLELKKIHLGNGEDAKLIDIDVNPKDYRIDQLPSNEMVRIRLNGPVESIPNFTANVSIQIDSVDGEPVEFAVQKDVKIHDIDGASGSFSLSIEDGDGYSFKNPIEVGKNDFRALFGDLNWFTAVRRYFEAFESGGKCFGMASTSGMYFIDSTAKPVSGNVSTWVHSYDTGQVGLMISQYHLSQFNILKYNNFNLETDLIKIVNKVKQNLKDGFPSIIAVSRSSGGGGHALLVTKMTDFIDNRIVAIKVYDSNYPNQECEAIIDLNSNSFIYEYNYDEVKLYPLSAFDYVPWNDRKEALEIAYSEYLYNLSSKFFSTSCPVHLLVVREDGLKLGYDSLGIFYNEIPNSTIERYKAETGDSMTFIQVPENAKYYSIISAFDTGSMNFSYYAPTEDGYLRTVVSNEIEIEAGMILLHSDTAETVLYERKDGKITPKASLRDTLYDVEATNSIDYLDRGFKWLKLYPNPSTSLISIKYNNSHEIKDIVLIDASGRRTNLLSNQYKIEEGQIMVDLNDVAKGTYYIEITSGTEVSIGRVMLQ